MPRKNKDNSDSEGSSESEESGPDLNKILLETQRKINEEHQKLAQNAFEEGQNVVADIKARYQHAIQVTHKKELNDIHKQVVASLNQENIRYFELIEKFKQYNQQIEDKVQDLIKSWTNDNEDCKKVGSDCEKTIEKAIKDEMKGYDIFKTAIGYKDIKASKE